jgi:UDP-N-acetylglucosamine 2-epimerase
MNEIFTVMHVIADRLVGVICGNQSIYQQMNDFDSPYSSGRATTRITYTILNHL